MSNFESRFQLGLKRRLIWYAIVYCSLKDGQSVTFCIKKAHFCLHDLPSQVWNRDRQVWPHICYLCSTGRQLRQFLLCFWFQFKVVINSRLTINLWHHVCFLRPKSFSLMLENWVWIFANVANFQNSSGFRILLILLHFFRVPCGQNQ